VFGSKSVHPILGVGSGMGPGRPGRSARVSDLGSALSGLSMIRPGKWVIRFGYGSG